MSVTLPAVEEQYPSTDDLDRVVTEPITNPITGCLRRARYRVEKGHTRFAYMTNNGGYCAIGAMWKEDLSPEQQQQAFNNSNTRRYAYLRIERQLASTTKAAINLLNTVAVERHPRAAGCSPEWSGALEWVNQIWRPGDAEFDELGQLGPEHRATVKAEILAIYDEAIDRSCLIPVTSELFPLAK